MNKLNKKLSPKAINSTIQINDIKTNKSAENSDTAARTSDVQQSNNEKQQSCSNLDNLLGIYYSSKIIGDNKFYGDNTLVLTNKLYAFNGNQPKQILPQ